MKEQLLKIIAEFATNVKPVLECSQTGSAISIKSTEHNFLIDVSIINTTNTHNSIKQLIDKLHHEMEDARSGESFIVIIKNINGKVMISNTLSPKTEVVIDQRNELSKLLRKNDMILLDNLVDSDPVWLLEILQERHIKETLETKKEDISLMINYLTQL